MTEFEKARPSAVAADVVEAIADALWDRYGDDAHLVIRVQIEAADDEGSRNAWEAVATRLSRF